MLRFELLQTPRQDGDVLIEPAASLWPEMIEQTARSRATDQADLLVAGVPVQALRQATRDRLFGSGTVEPVMACGHQPEFIHPGVWAKHVVVRHVADTLGAHGVDLVVDHDAPRTTALVVPCLRDGQHLPSLDVGEHSRDAFRALLGRRSVAVFTGTAGAAYEGRPSLSPSVIENIRREVDGNLLPALFLGVSAGDARDCATDSEPTGVRPESPMLAEYCLGLAQTDRPTDFVEQHLAARNRVDRLFTATLQEVRVSKAFDGPFLADILLGLNRFAVAYNASLADYRRDQHVRGSDRPLPDLKTVGDRLEAPFWIYQPHQQRMRLWVAARGDALKLYADNRPVGRLSRADLLQNPACTLASLVPWVIRPRALTLTLWARLLVCDLFVHGIGGAKYDRVTDGIFRRYYHCEPPGYACVTATLRLPLPRFPVADVDLTAARRRVRDVRFNPHRYLDHLPDDLLAERARLIGESRRLHQQQGSRLERRVVFTAIRQLNARLATLDPSVLARLEGDLDRTRQQLAGNGVADSREFFYALQPQARLEMLAVRLVEAARAVPVQT